MLLKNLEFVWDLVDRTAREVGLVGVLGNHPQRLLLTTASDHDRDTGNRPRGVDRVGDLVVLPRETHLLSAKHRDHDLQCLFELLEPVGERAKLKAEGVMFELEPPGTDPQRRPA